MKFFVIRLRHVLLGGIIVSAVLLFCFGMGHMVDVFQGNSSDRKIPIYSVNRDDNAIALTFDCAWNADDVSEILNILDQYDCKATFFVVGDWVEKYPDALKQIYQRGHEIGNHSYNHADYTKLSQEKIIADLDRCDALIEQTIGIRPKLVRAPSGGYNNTVISACESSGRTYIQWSVDSLDYKLESKDEIIKRSTQGVSAGDILLMHNGTKYTAELLPSILENLKKRFTLTNISGLIYNAEYDIDHAGKQFKKA